MKSTLETELTSSDACTTKSGRHELSQNCEGAPESSANWSSAVVALAVLTLCEVAVYWFSVRLTGFYLDDWTMMSYLHFSPQDLISLVSRSLNDARILPRPLEALHFPLAWMAFKANPMGYHIVNCLLEVLAGWLLYLTVNRLSASKTIALSAAVIFLVYPIHDATHYWMVATSVTLSLVLYMISLWSSVRYAAAVLQADAGRTKYLLVSVLAYAASIFNYEAFAPLCVVNAASVLSMLWGRRDAVVSAVKTFVLLAPTCVGLALYQRVLASTLGSNFVPPQQIEVGHFFDVIGKGVIASLSPELLSFSIARAQDAIAVGISSIQIQFFALFAVATFAAFAYFEIGGRANSNASQSSHPKKDCLNIFALGALCLLASYTIFGVARGYDPQLASIYSRVNTGAAVGASLMLAAAFTWLSRLICSRLRLPTLGIGSALVTALVTTIVLAPLMTLSTMADWGMANSWRRSWDVQRRVAQILKAHQSELQPGDSIILANVPRYVMWSPVFDGVWDFQAMMRLCLNDQKINGGVVSERLRVSDGMIEDVSMGFSCAQYDYKRLFVLIPHPEQLIQVRSAQEFIDVVQSKGMFFGLSQSVIDGWRKSLKNGR